MRKILMILTVFLLLLCTACTDSFSIYPYVPDNNSNPDDPNRSILTIKYLYEDGTEAAEKVWANIYAPKHYFVYSPSISGYTPDKERVSVTASGEDVEIIVTYTKECSCCHRSTYIPIITPSVTYY